MERAGPRPGPWGRTGETLRKSTTALTWELVPIGKDAGLFPIGRAVSGLAVSGLASSLPYSPELAAEGDPFPLPGMVGITRSIPSACSGRGITTLSRW